MPLVPFFETSPACLELQDPLQAAWQAVLRSGSFILGPEVERFERSFADALGSKHCIGVANGLDALALTLQAWEIGPGDEVIVPSHTYIATWLAISRVGATIVPVEVTPDTCLLDPDRVSAAITPKTKALLPVHLYGQTAPLEPLLALAQKFHLRLLSDAAQAHGALYQGRPLASFGDAAAYSFYPSKNLGALGDAGAILTSDDATAERLRYLRNYGSLQRYVHRFQGTNSRLDPLQAAFLSVFLPHLPRWNERRRSLASRYLSALRDLPDLVLPTEASGNYHVWHLFVIRHPRRDELQRYLADRGIQTLIHYPIPPHLSEAYSDLPLARTSFPLAETLASTVLSLPLGPYLSEDAQDAVISALRSFCLSSPSLQDA